ncbi:MAG: hypothetical protein WCL71_09735, partial [Deltaproteobacteria bacterium]
MAGAVALGVAHDGGGGEPALAVLPAQDEDRQWVALEVLPLDGEDLPAHDLAVVGLLEWGWIGAH